MQAPRLNWHNPPCCHQSAHTANVVQDNCRLAISFVQGDCRLMAMGGSLLLGPAANTCIMSLVQVSCCMLTCLEPGDVLGRAQQLRHDTACTHRGGGVLSIGAPAVSMEEL